MSRTRPTRLIIATLALGAIVGGALVATPATAATVPTAERHTPSRVPDRITLVPAPDPTTEQVISWRSSTAVTQGFVEYRTITPTAYAGGVQTQSAATRVEQTTDLGYVNTTHTATLTGLRAGTTYQYRVGDGTNFSEWQRFETSATSTDGFSFVYLGDIQNGILSDASRVVRNALRDGPKADMVVQIGDMVNDAASDEQWGDLYEAFAYGLGSRELVTTPGNHEYEGGLSDQWSNQFSFPDNGPEGQGGVYDELNGTVYFTDHQGVRFVSLNSNVVDTEGLQVQADWLEKVLSDNPNQWTVVFFHHPVYSLDEGRNNLGIRQSWGPILERHNVDLVLTGHDHAYGRGNLSANETDLPAGADPALSSTGPVYVTSSVGSKFYEAGPRHWNENGGHLRRLASGIQTYQIVDVKDGTLRFESRTADGQFFDGFTITKSEGRKLVVDGVAPQVIDPGTPAPCLGCEPNPDPGPTEPTTPPEVEPFSYETAGSLDAVQPRSSATATHRAALPAGVAFHQSRDRLYLGDQNDRKVFEIDPATDTVTRTITLPENVRDLGIDEQNELLYVGQQNRNWVVVSVSDATFGQVVRGPYPTIESNRSIDVDPVRGFVYVAVPARGVEVFAAATGESLGVINGTADAYYVAADPATGWVVTTTFSDVAGDPGIKAYDAADGFAKKWEMAVRPNARQVDIDSAHGLLYIGYTGTSATAGGFSVHDLATGASHADMVGPAYGKDGYGIAVDEETQRVYVSNRDFRLNPPGEELTPYAVTVSVRNDSGSTPTPGPTPEPTPEPTPDPTPAIEPWQATALTVIPTAGAEGEVEKRPVGSAVDHATGTLFVADELRPARVHVVDPATDTIQRTMTVPTADPASDGMRDLAFDPTGNRLVVGYSSSWLVMDATSGERLAGPFAVSGGVRGLDVDWAGGRVFVGVRGTGFEVRSLANGDLIGTVEGPADAGAWRSHGVAWDAVGRRLYVGNSDASGSTEGIHVYDADLSLIARVPVAAADYRSLAVDGAAGLLVAGDQTDVFDQSGVTVYRTSDLSMVKRLSAHAYGNKVYGVSIDPVRHTLYVSARERFPAGLIKVTLPTS